MATIYSSFCSDFYINQRLNLKLDLSLRRDVILGFFDRVRRDFPDMDRIRRLPGEVALESSSETDAQARWIALRKTSIRSGIANPVSDSLRDDADLCPSAMALHRLVLETCPYYLDVSPLDIDHLELLFGFDLYSSGNHDAIVCKALMGGSAVASMIDRPGVLAVECQPMIGFCLADAPEYQAFLEVKTRSGSRSVRSPSQAATFVSSTPDSDSPISVYLILRRIGGVKDIRQLPLLMLDLESQAHRLVEEIVLPQILDPLRSCIVTG